MHTGPLRVSLIARLNTKMEEILYWNVEWKRRDSASHTLLSIKHLLGWSSMIFHMLTVPKVIFNSRMCLQWLLNTSMEIAAANCWLAWMKNRRGVITYWPLSTTNNNITTHTHTLADLGQRFCQSGRDVFLHLGEHWLSAGRTTLWSSFCASSWTNLPAGS